MYTAKEYTLHYLQAARRRLEEKLKTRMKAGIATYPIMLELVAIETVIEYIEDEVINE